MSANDTNDTPAGPAPELTKEEEAAALAFHAKSLTPRMQALLIDPPDVEETPELERLLAAVGRELRRILPVFEKDANLSVCVWPLNDKGIETGCSTRSFAIPDGDEDDSQENAEDSPAT